MSDEDNGKNKRKKLRRYYNVDESKLDELEGFEDLIDNVIDDEEKKRRKQHDKKVQKYGENYELYNYLEVENERLSIIDDFLSNKLHNMRQHSQSQALISKQEHRRVDLRKELIQRMTPKSSSLMRQMQIVFDKSFTGRDPK